MTAITQSVDLDRRGRVAVLTVNNPPSTRSASTCARACVTG